MTLLIVQHSVPLPCAICRRLNYCRTLHGVNIFMLLLLVVISAVNIPRHPPPLATPVERHYVRQHNASVGVLCIRLLPPCQRFLPVHALSLVAIYSR